MAESKDKVVDESFDDEGLEMTYESQPIKWSDLTPEFKNSLMRIYGMMLLTNLALYISGLVAIFVVYFKLFSSVETGEAALLLGQLQLVTNGIGVLSLNFGGHLSE